MLCDVCCASHSSMNTEKREVRNGVDVVSESNSRGNSLSTYTAPIPYSDKSDGIVDKLQLYRT